jgi:hypothetical protein
VGRCGWGQQMVSVRHAPGRVGATQQTEYEIRQLQAQQRALTPSPSAVAGQSGQVIVPKETSRRGHATLLCV